MSKDLTCVLHLGMCYTFNGKPSLGISLISLCLFATTIRLILIMISKKSLEHNPKEYLRINNMLVS